MGKDSTAAVNHWRGQCLDNFVRVENSVLKTIEAWRASSCENSPSLNNVASNRTRNLRQSIVKQISNVRLATSLSGALDLWSHREAERNELVHGCFTIKDRNGGWVLINNVTKVCNQMVERSERMQTQAQAEAFLLAIIDERKFLVSAMTDFAEASF